MPPNSGHRFAWYQGPIRGTMAKLRIDRAILPARAERQTTLIPVVAQYSLSSTRICIARGDDCTLICPPGCTSIQQCRLGDESHVENDVPVRDRRLELLDGRPARGGVDGDELGAALRAGPVRELVCHLPSMRGHQTPPAGRERRAGGELGGQLQELRVVSIAARSASSIVRAYVLSTYANRVTYMQS